MKSERPIIALPESIGQAGLEMLQKSASVHMFESLAELLEARENQRTDAIIVRSIVVSSEVMDRLPGLKVIGRHGAGLDNIDLDAAFERGILVVNTPASNTRSVAEYVIGAIYLLLKRFTENADALRRGSFTASGGSLPGQVQRMGLSGRELSECTLGIVGYGAIGREVADLAEANGMKIVFYDPFVEPEASIEKNRMQCLTLQDLLAASDVVSLHVPGTADGTPLIGAEELECMRPGCYLINAARGSILCVDAVNSALSNGKLAGAVIDVYAQEPPETEYPLFAFKNVMLTPHMAAMTDEALARMAVDVVDATLQALDVSVSPV